MLLPSSKSNSQAVRDFLRGGVLCRFVYKHEGYCADLSTSMKFGTYVDQNILNSFLRAPKPALIGANIFTESKMDACRYLIYSYSVTKSHRIINNSSFSRFLTSWILDLNSISTYQGPFSHFDILTGTKLT